MTVQALPTGRIAEDPRATPLALFASIFLGLSPRDPTVVAACRDARSRSTQALRSGRAAVESEGRLAYEVLYRSWKGRASQTRTVIIPAPDPAIAALGGLRHRQRAALALRHVIGLSEVDTASVIGVRPTEIDRIVDGAITALAKVRRGPADVPAELRRAGAAALAPRKEREAPQPARLPRSVVRTILADQPLAPAPVAMPQSPLPEETVALSPPTPVAMPQSQLPEAKRSPSDRAAVRAAVPGSGRRRPIRRRLAPLVALVAMVVALVFPSSASVSRAPTLAPAPTVGAPATVVRALAPSGATRPAPSARDIVLVRSGDTLWAIAGRAYRDPARWPEIFRANRGRVMTSGERFTDADLIKPGWRLAVPGARRSA